MVVVTSLLLVALEEVPADTTRAAHPPASNWYISF